MKTFVIERAIPGAGEMTMQNLRAVAQRSCNVLFELGPRIQWVHSYVTGDKLFCVYRAPNPEMIREHARLGGFPAEAVLQVTHVIDPTTAE
jgi:hypothetical protein